MKSYELEIVFKELQFDHVPLEIAVFDASKNSFRIKAETELGEIKEITFSQVIFVSLESSEKYDMNLFCYMGFFHVTLYREVDNQKRTDNIHTYLFPTETNVWKIQCRDNPQLSWAVRSLP